jgi:hypothetical protein
MTLKGNIIIMRMLRMRNVAMGCLPETRGPQFLNLRVEEEKREKWAVVRDTTGGGNRIYHQF